MSVHILTVQCSSTLSPVSVHSFCTYLFWNLYERVLSFECRLHPKPFWHHIFPFIFMMNYGLFAALAIAFVLTAAAVLVFKRRGPWGAAWTFFLFLFLALWITSIYLPNVGPVYWGIAWVPILIVGLFLAFLLTAALPNANEWRDESIRDTETNKTDNVTTRQLAPGIRWFWILVAIMVMLILVGMINPQKAL